jgi:hypothetical protein
VAVGKTKKAFTAEEEMRTQRAGEIPLNPPFCVKGDFEEIKYSSSPLFIKEGRGDLEKRREIRRKRAAGK